MMIECRRENKYLICFIFSYLKIKCLCVFEKNILSRNVNDILCEVTLIEWLAQYYELSLFFYCMCFVIILMQQIIKSFAF